jgi:hypothetical protein
MPPENHTSEVLLKGALGRTHPALRRAGGMLGGCDIYEKFLPPEQQTWQTAKMRIDPRSRQTLRNAYFRDGIDHILQNYGQMISF